VSPEGELLAVRSGSIFAGDTKRIREIAYEGLNDISSVCHFKGRFWIGHERNGICRWDGEGIVQVRPMKKLVGFAETEPLSLTSRETLLALSPAELVESTDGVDFRTVVTTPEIADVVGSADVYWNKKKSSASLPS
jgi:hypothetical protein